MYSTKYFKKIIIVFLIITFALTCKIVSASLDKKYDSDIYLDTSNILDDTLLASNQFTQADDLTSVDNFLNIPTTYQLVGENSYYKLYMEEESYAIRVINKIDGFIYGSSLSDKDENLDDFNQTWEGIVNSCITLSYYSYNEQTGVYVTKEESLLKDDNSSSTYQLIENGFIANLYFGESQISLQIIVQLDGEYLRVEVPNNSIQEESYELKSIKIYPFFGAVYGNSIPGYILVPDGSGALIRYQEIDTFKDIYQFSYYGQDDSIQTDLSYEPDINFPVSGMIHGINQHGFISMVDQGAAEATLVVSPAKRNLKYYYTYNEFLFRALYQTPLSESDSMNSSGRLVVEENINDCNPVLKYKFLNGQDANYVGMANNYREYLLDSGLITDKVLDNEYASIFIDVIAAESKPGFITDEYVEMTDIESLLEILDDLQLNNVKPLISYKGYSQGGVTKSGIIYDSFNRKLGDLNDLLEYTKTHNLDIYFQINPMIGYEKSKFSVYKDVSNRINMNLNEYSGFNKSYYYLKPTSVIKSINKSVIGLEKLSIDNILIDSIGNLIYSDYSDQTISRSSFIKLLNEELSDIDKSILLYQANDYMLKYTDKYLLTPLNSSRYRIYSDTVPFVPYVLSGVMDKYSRYMNFNSASKVELLKLVDYGVNPSYLITSESAYALQDSELQQIYSSSYNVWSQRIKSDFDYINNALISIHNASVLERTYIASGVYLIKYDNGIDIYINYANTKYYFSEDQNDYIDSLSYKVVNNNA